MYRATKTDCFAFAACLSTIAASAIADTQFLSLTPTYLPSYFGLGIGSYPEYLGSDDAAIGVAPFGRYSFGEQRYASLEVNYATINLLENRNWRAGPAGMYRFGREDVDDPIVDRLPDIEGTFELGGFISYENVGSDPRERWSVGASFTHGVTGDNDGYTIAASARRWMPVGEFAALGFYAGTTYGSSDYMDTFFSVSPAGAADSGLSVFEAESGVRDVRLSVVYVQPLSRTWLAGGGLMFSRLLNDAADSPIVSERGDRDQLVFGLGISRAF